MGPVIVLIFPFCKSDSKKRKTLDLLILRKLGIISLMDLSPSQILTITKQKNEVANTFHFQISQNHPDTESELCLRKK